ncbi:uncharacterized protein [Branchiostoma lanceolatum]|uniref:uncharacterized protein n=1 Tax=Branchiostoma lanceolatum TaxID=7740 RepID=UPI0034527E29
MNAIAVVILSLSVAMGNPNPQGSSYVGFEVHRYRTGGIKGEEIQDISVGLSMELNVGFVNGSTAMYIHDYNLNLEAIVPVCGKVCFVRPLPDVSPRPEDILKMESRFSDNALIIENEDLDMVEFVECGDQIIDTTVLGDTIHSYCADRTTFLLEDVASGTKKLHRVARGVDGRQAVLARAGGCQFNCGICTSSASRRRRQTPKDLNKNVDKFARRFTHVICDKSYQKL